LADDRAGREIVATPRPNQHAGLYVSALVSGDVGRSAASSAAQQVRGRPSCIPRRRRRPAMLPAAPYFAASPICG